MFRAELREQQKSLMRIRILKEEEELLAAKEKRVYQKIEHENNVKEHRKKMEILHCRIKGFDFYLFKLDDINIYNFEYKSISIVVSLEKSLE